MSKVAIFATDLAFGFGKLDGLPWPYNRNDMKFFKENTLNKTLLCGSKTYELIKHLPNRKFIVVSRNDIKYPDAMHPNKVIDFIKSVSNIVVVGGTSLLIPEVLGQLDKVYVSKFKSVNNADVWLSRDTAFWLTTKPCITLHDDDELIIREYIL